MFAILVALLALPLIKLGGVLDETRAAIREASNGVSPILEETTTTIREANKQIGRVDTITRSVADVSGNVSALVALFAGQPVIGLFDAVPQHQAVERAMRARTRETFVWRFDTVDRWY